MNSRRWTCGEDKWLRKAIDNNLHVAVIATELKRSYGAINSRIAKHNFSKMLEERCNDK